MKGVPPTLAVEFGRRAIPSRASQFSGMRKIHQEYCGRSRRRRTCSRGSSRRVSAEIAREKTSSHHHQKKVSHGGHHGGAWKVAYADFVTAMMALFIVLWLLNSSQQIKEAVGGYFKDPPERPKT